MGKCHDLLEASRNGNVAVVCKILEQCAKKGGPLSSFRRSPSINWQDVNGYTPMHHACLNGHMEIVRLLLAHNAAVDIPDIRGSTPLYLASWAGHADIVKMLLMHSLRPSDPNAQTTENETPLHCAAQHGHYVVVAILLTYGADPTIRNNSFQTPLDLASQFGRLQVVQILIRSHPELIEPFRVYDETVALENGHSPPYTITPTKHIYTHSCLHLAARNGHTKVVETLLGAGVDVNILTHSGSALHEAALCGKKSVVCTLLRAGIDPYAVDGNGKTAMDILKDYPPHVTYEIVSIINDFCKDSSQMENATHFMPIKDANDNTSPSEYRSTPTTANGDSHQMPQRHDKQSITTNFFVRQVSLDRYTPMEPIMYPKSDSNRSTPEHILEFKPICASKLLNRRLGDDVVARFPKLAAMTPNNQGPAAGNGATNQYRCVDEYVEMRLPQSGETTPIAETTPQQKQQPLTPLTPVASPRANVEFGDYANISIINQTQSNRNKHQHDTDPLHEEQHIIRISPTSPGSDGNKISNGSNDEQILRRNHSPTPDCPPPSAQQAESAIFEYVKRPEKSHKRKSLRLENCNSQFFNGLKSFIWEDQREPNADEIGDSMSSSVISEFVGDVPFAGLFKGSSLNLAADTEEVPKQNAIKDLPSGLRSPSLVKSVTPLPAKRTVTIQGATKETPAKNQLDIDIAKVWDEINTIFESIGNEVAATDAKLEAIDEGKSLTNTLRKKSLHIRKPAELLLGPNSPSQDQSDMNPNWCHSANMLIYSYVLYDVYYLGSTVIRELHGTASTRKSIQKLKREDTPARQLTEANGLMQDISSSTRKMKAQNEETRQNVGIALSHAGVRFIDSEKKTTICVHDIENINCVSQDTEDLRYFAYITRENDIHYCHVFMVDNQDLATEIILTLGQAFEVAYQLTLMNREESNALLQELPANKRLSYIDIVDKI